MEKLTQNEENELKEKYPEFKDSTYFETFKNYMYSIGSYGYGAFKSFTNVITFNWANIWSQKNKNEIMIEMIKNRRTEEFSNEMMKIMKKNKKMKIIF